MLFIVALVSTLPNIILDKTQLQFFRLGVLGFPIKFKHMVVLSNKTQTMLYFSIIIRLNVVMYLNSIGKLNVSNLNNRI